MNPEELARRQDEMKNRPASGSELTTGEKDRETLARSTALGRQEILAKLYIGGSYSLEECAVILREQYGFEHISLEILRADARILRRILKDNLKKTVNEARAEQVMCLAAHLGYIVSRHSREGERYENYHKDFLEVVNLLMKLTGTAMPETLQIAIQQKRDEDLSAFELVTRAIVGLDEEQIGEVLKFAEALPRKRNDLPWLTGEVIEEGPGEER